MATLLSCNSLEKSFGSKPLFREISISIADGERIGVLGPNGAGKSTLLKIIAGIETADDGTISRKKNLRMAYLAQAEDFNAKSTVHEILAAALEGEHLSEEDKWARIGEVRSIIGLSDLEQAFGSLSGGWRKRVALAAQLVTRPELLLLDEPTNHLDLEGINWLEKFISEAECAIAMISHDRTLLENVASRIFEINRIYPQGCYTTEGNYSKFLERREDFLLGISRYEDALRNKVRREVEWLRRGPKARGTKAKGRIQEANRLIGELKEYEGRSASQGTADIDFLASGRRTKRLIELQRVTKQLGGRTLFKDLDVLLSPGVRLGIVGANGSGKSTLLKVLAGTLAPDKGEMFCAPALRVVTFEQDRATLDKTISLKKSLAPDGDSVVHRDRELHVASWARRFLFRSEQLDQPVRSLSGGEQARLLIAKLMLEPADILLLDEPTNDLDIDTLQVLEESLEEFPGAVVLITHDRFMLDRVSTTVLGLFGDGRAEFFASYGQWEETRAEELQELSRSERKAKPEPVKKSKVERLSYNEQKELKSLERQIDKLEAAIKQIKEELIKPEVAENAPRLTELCADLHKQEQQLEKLVERWSELEARK